MAAVYPWPPRQRRGVLGDAGATSPESPQTSEFTEGSGPQTEASPVKHTTKDKISRGAESSLPVKFRRPCHWSVSVQSVPHRAQEALHLYACRDHRSRPQSQWGTPNPGHDRTPASLEGAQSWETRVLQAPSPPRSEWSHACTPPRIPKRPKPKFTMLNQPKKRNRDNWSPPPTQIRLGALYPRPPRHRRGLGGMRVLQAPRSPRSPKSPRTPAQRLLNPGAPVPLPLGSPLADHQISCHLRFQRIQCHN